MSLCADAGWRGGGTAYRLQWPPCCAVAVCRRAPWFATAAAVVRVDVELGGGGTRRWQHGPISVDRPARRCERTPASSTTAPSTRPNHCSTMSSPLTDVWEAAAASPFQPAIGKDSQFALGFALLFACELRCCAPSWRSTDPPPALLLTGFFGLSMPTTALDTPPPHCSPAHRPLSRQPAPRWRSRIDSIWVRTPCTQRTRPC